jgi:hypothetical protein
MNTTDQDTLARLTAAGFEKCLLRMTAVCPGSWQLAGVRVYSGTARDAFRRDEKGNAPVGALRVKIKGDRPFITALLFRPEDTVHISGCFAEGGFYEQAGADQTDSTIVEIGNIVLNALANALLRAFRKTAIPSVPAYFKGDPGAVEAWLGAGPGDFDIVRVTFNMLREGRSVSAEALAFLPPALAAETPLNQ